jgi:WD40 repeat protein
VYDLRDEKWNAVISNGSGGMGKVAHVEFGSSEDEVLVWSGFASKMTVWDLRTGRTVEVMDVKFEGKRGTAYRPTSGKGRGGEVLAVLCRAAGQDVLLMLASRTYKVLKRVELPTIDAQNLKWSTDGRWCAVWDSPSSGFGLHIYTADGHLYRTITRESPPLEDAYNEWAVEGLGIKTVEWVPGGEYLAVGGWDRRVRILSTRTFAPIVFLDHTATICVPSVPVYTETVDAVRVRSYTLTPQPATPPKAQAEKNDVALMKAGISILAFNIEGTMCATRDDSTPTTVWIWDLRSLKPKIILIQHAPVKSLIWHPSNPALLLIQSVHDAPTVYLYTTHTFSESISGPSRNSDGASGPPAILDFREKIKKPAGSLPPKYFTTWLPTPVDKKPAFTFGHNQGYTIVWPEGKDQILRFENPDAEGEDSDDSLYEILTGRKPVPQLRESLGASGSDDGGFQGVDIDGDGEVTMMEAESTGSFNDTFRERRNKALKSVEETGEESRGTSVFDESGMDEMF